MGDKRDMLLDILDYDATTGLLFWKRRGLEYFKTKNSWSIWNSRFSGKEAMIYIDRYGYKQGRVNGGRMSAHRAIMIMHFGNIDGKEVDHINGIRTDNRLCNLRLVSRIENAQNRGIMSHNTSGIVGVSWHKGIGKWVSSIKVDRRTISLGSYDSLLDAASARKAAEAYHGFHENHGNRPGARLRQQGKG